MPGVKRPHDADDASAGNDNVHASRKPRLDHDESRAELAQIFIDLRDEIQNKRIDATRRLLKNLSTKSGDQRDRLDYAVTRLIKGVCSGAKAARPGFSIALVEALRMGFASQLQLANVVDKATALTNAEGKASSEERRDYLIGRRFAFQAILQTGVLENASNEDANYVFQAVAELATLKDWLRAECGAMLCEFIRGQESEKLKNEIARVLLDSWASKSLLKSPEGVALWLTVKQSFPDVKLPKGVWHHNNPLSSQERATLSKILLKNAVEADDDTDGTKKRRGPGARQLTPSFAWQVILAYLYNEDKTTKFAQFWEECIATQMFSPNSSTERKSLGLQIVTKALTTAPASLLHHVVHANIIQCIVDQRAKPDRYLFEAAKLPLNQMATRAKKEPAAASAIICKLLAVIPSNFDKLTRTTMDTVLAAADSQGLADIVSTVADLLRAPGSDDAGESEKKRRVFADVLLSIVRSRRSEPSQFFADGDGAVGTLLVGWLQMLLCSFAHLGYSISSEATSPPLSASSRSLLRERLMSTLGYLVDLPLQQGIIAPILVAETLYESKAVSIEGLDGDAKSALKDARKLLKDAGKKIKTADTVTVTAMRAFQLLFALSVLQVYKQEPDSLGILQDITSCYQSPKDDGDASTMLIELLLSFVSKPSALFRKLAEQVFSAFAPEVTVESLQSMIDILSQKESLAGQQELFDQHGDDEGESAEDDDSDDSSEGDDAEEPIDVEDDSDVEIINGNIANSNSDSSDSEEENKASATSPGDSDEEAAFDLKLAAALGTTGMDGNASDSDGSDMDDDQMLALEPHLTTIFRERKKSSSTKAEHKSARENITNFKNRVLDLLVVYVRSQHTNPIALNLIHPLISLARTTTNQPTARKSLDVLETYFDACKKHRAYPSLPDGSEPGFELLAAVHSEMRLGGSKVHASACSRSSQFLAKILVAMDAKSWRRIAGMYAEMQEEWRADPKSRIHGSVFNEWHSWSMQR